MRFNIPVDIHGHLHVQDDLGKVWVDQSNAVHPQNLSRVIARALSNESNYAIHRIAFGNGGTQTDAAFSITYNTPNDGQSPDVRTWDSRLYNETYSEIIDEGNIVSNPLLGADLGSAGPNTGTRPGGGSYPSADPISVPHVSGPGVHSNELGLTSEVVITAVLNRNEPRGQFASDNLSPSEVTDSSFTFDELGLYTSGSPAIDSSGIQDVDVGNKTAADDSGLLANTQYSFGVNIDNGGIQPITFTTPISGGSGTGGEILYGDICEAINNGDVNWNPAWGGSNPLPGTSTISITDNLGNFATISGAQTYGFLRIVSGTVGVTSTVSISSGVTGLDVIASINPPNGGIIMVPESGRDAGLQNDPVTSGRERERLLTHLIFSPVLKSSNRVLTVTYTLTVSVARTQ
jgi:hypothetical protein